MDMTMLGQLQEIRSRKSNGCVQSAAFVACIILPLAVMLSAGCGRTGDAASAKPARASAVSSVGQTGLSFSTATIDLGFLPRGGQSQQIVTLRNASSRPLSVARFRTSCDCLEAHCEAGEISPSEYVPVLVRIDLSKDPGFVGSLMGSIEALDQRGDRIASVGVAVSIDPIAEGIIGITPRP